MFLKPDEYTHAINLLEKSIPSPPILDELAAYTHENLNITPLDYICDKTNNGLTRLRLVLWDYSEKKRVCDGANYNKAMQKQIATEFATLARKHKLHPDYQNADNIFVAYETLADEISRKILHTAKSELMSLMEGNIWKIEIIFESIHIFYETDAQIEENRNNGYSDHINQRCTEILRRYDKYNIYKNGFTCIFTSKQTLDEKYSGSMFYYTR